MNKYRIVREDYGDEDKEIVVFDVQDVNNKLIVFSSYSNQEAEDWIDRQKGIDYSLKNNLVSA